MKWSKIVLPKLDLQQVLERVHAVAAHGGADIRRRLVDDEQVLEVMECCVKINENDMTDICYLIFINDFDWEIKSWMFMHMD